MFWGGDLAWIHGSYKGMWWPYVIFTNLYLYHYILLFTRPIFVVVVLEEVNNGSGMVFNEFERL